MPIGNALWIQPQAEPHADMGQWLQAFYASTEPLPPDFLADRVDPPAQERDWSSDDSHHYAALRADLEKQGKPMQVPVPVGTARLQTLSLLELLRSLKKSALSLVDTEGLSVFFIWNPTAKQSQAPAEPLPYPHPFELKNKSKKSELLPPFK